MAAGVHCAVRAVLLRGFDPIQDPSKNVCGSAFFVILILKAVGGAVCYAISVYNFIDYTDIVNRLKYYVLQKWESGYTIINYLQFIWFITMINKSSIDDLESQLTHSRNWIEAWLPEF